MCKIKIETGFSFIELVVTLVVVAIIATYALPRLDLISIRNQGFYNLATSTIRYGQKRAVSTGCIVEINISSSGCNITWVGCAGNAQLSNPSSNNTDFCSDGTSEGTVSAGNFRFDQIGRPMTTGNVVLTSPQNIGVGSRTIRVEAETGYVYEP